MGSTDGSLSPLERVKAALARLDTEADDVASKPHRFRHAVRAYLEALCDATNGESLLTEYGEFVHRKTACGTPYAIARAKGRRHVRPDATRILRRSSPQWTDSLELRNESDAIAHVLNDDSARKTDFYLDRVEPPDGITRDEFRKAELERFLTEEACRDLESWASAADDLASEAEGYCADGCHRLLQIQKHRYQCFEMETAPTFADRITAAARFLAERLESSSAEPAEEGVEIMSGNAFPLVATRRELTTDPYGPRAPAALWLPSDWESWDYPSIDDLEAIRQWFAKQIENEEHQAKVAKVSPETLYEGSDIPVVRDAYRLVRNRWIVSRKRQGYHLNQSVQWCIEDPKLKSELTRYSQSVWATSADPTTLQDNTPLKGQRLPDGPRRDSRENDSEDD